MRDRGLDNDWVSIATLMARRRFQNHAVDKLLVAIQACVGTGYQNRRRFELYWAEWGVPSETWVRLAPGNEHNRDGD